MGRGLRRVQAVAGVRARRGKPEAGIKPAAVFFAQQRHAPAFGRKRVGGAGDEPAADAAAAAFGDRLAGGEVGFAVHHRIGPHHTDKAAVRAGQRPEAREAVRDGGAGFGIKGVAAGGVFLPRESQRRDGADRRVPVQREPRGRGAQRQRLPGREREQVEFVLPRQRGRAVGCELFHPGKAQEQRQFLPVAHRAAELSTAAGECQRRIRQPVQPCRRAGVIGPEAQVPAHQRAKKRLAADGGGERLAAGRVGQRTDAAAHACGAVSGRALTMRLYSCPRTSKLG